MSNKCPTCKGSGEVEIQNPVRVHTTIKEVCPTCHGSGLHGYVHGQHMPCTDCRGTGLGSSPESPQTHVVTEGLAAGTDEFRPDTKQNETEEFETELKQLVMDVSVASTADNIRQSKARAMINRAIGRTRVAHQSALAAAHESGRAEGARGSITRLEATKKPHCTDTKGRSHGSCCYCRTCHWPNDGECVCDWNDSMDEAIAALSGGKDGETKK